MTAPMHAGRTRRWRRHTRLLFVGGPFASVVVLIAVFDHLPALVGGIAILAVGTVCVLCDRLVRATAAVRRRTDESARRGMWPYPACPDCGSDDLGNGDLLAPHSRGWPATVRQCSNCDSMWDVFKGRLPMEESHRLLTARSAE